MKTKILKSVSIALFMSASLFSCSSDWIVNDENTSDAKLLKPAPPGFANFYYRQNGVSTYSISIDAFANSSDAVIYAMDGSLNVIKIPLSSIAVGLYYIGTANNFYHNTPTDTWYGKDGYVQIIWNNSNLISEIFKVSGVGIFGITSINGYFDLIPIVP